MRGLCYFFLSILTQVSSSTSKVIGLFGENVTLPCKYDTKAYGVLSFCWGQGKVPRSKCSNTIISSEDGAVVFRQSPRYQLLGNVADGDVSLTILNAQWTDAGEYGCRVEIPGWFNDYKVNQHLVMEEAPVEQPVTKEWTLTSNAQDILTTYNPKFDLIGLTTTEEDSQTTKRKTFSVLEDFKTFLGVGNIGRMAAIFFCTVIIILVFIFRRGFLPRRTLEHPHTSTAENIYESVPPK